MERIYKSLYLGVFITICLTLGLAGCNKDNGTGITTVTVSGVNILGVWVDTDDSNETLTFKSDGTWIWIDLVGPGTGSRDWDAEASGNWTLSGNTISLWGTNHHGNSFSTTAEVIDNDHIYISSWIESNQHSENYVRR